MTQFVPILVPLLIWALSIHRSVERENTPAYTIPDVEIESTNTHLRKEDGLLYQSDDVFSGYLVTYYPDGVMKRRTPYAQGRKQGTERGWYADASPQFERPYQMGKKVGVHRGWWENGKDKYLFHFENDLHQGVAQEWFPDGMLYRYFNYDNGKEAGTQRMWNEDGTLKANYVIKDGRRYGLLGAKPCTNDG